MPVVSLPNEATCIAHNGARINGSSKFQQNDYEELIAVWEASVRATHDFLGEQDIAFLKPLILEQYFDAVDLKCMVTIHAS